MNLRIAFLIVVVASSVQALTIFVAPDGNDAWSGRREVRDGTNGPKATLMAALQSARVARSRPDFAEAIEIKLRGGAYELAAPIVFTPADSGASQTPLVISAYRDEKPLLSGGTRIRNLRQVATQSNLFVARVEQPNFRSLFIDGKRMQRARAPNEGFFRIAGPSPQDKPVKLKFKPGDIKKEWAERGDVEAVALLAWADFRMFIREVDASNHVATLSTNPRPSNQEANARYYIENAPDALDAPGEWYLDARIRSLSVYGREDENLSAAEVIAPRLEELAIFQGEKDHAVQNIVLRNLTFSHTDWDPGTNGYADTQAAVAVRGDLRAEFARHCAIEDCTFSHLAGYAIELGKGCQNWKITGNEISDVGAGGVRIGETAKRSDPAELNHSNLLADNHMHHLGRVYPPAVGVFILRSGTNRVAHNHIHDLYYTAVSLGWNWGYQETPCRENVIEFNHMHDIGQGMLSDMGAVYTLGIQKGTVVRNNLIHDVNSFTYGGWGLYPDEGSSDILWENNVVYRTKSAGFHQHYGRDNIVRNNIFAFGKEHQLMRTREEGHTSFIFTNNIVYFDSGTLLGSNWKNEKFVTDRNVYFDTRMNASVTFAGVSFQDWKKRGHDTNSLIADPKFRDAAKFDFSLRADSPALKLGFKPIDLSRVGVRKKASR